MQTIFRFAAFAVTSLCFTLVSAGSPAAAEGPSIATMPMVMLAAANTPIALPSINFPNFGMPAAASAKAATTSKPSAATLAALVSDHEASDTDGAEHECIANAVYFESNGEPLEGELAVAQVILNRASSGRFAGSACGVVRQPHQFSFVHRGGVFPSVNRASAAWRKAVAVAAIARDSLWKPIVRDALYFGCGAAGKIRIAALGHHVFYR